MPSPGCHTGDLGGQLGITPLPSPPPLLPGEAVMGTREPRFSQGNPPPGGSHGTFLNELSPPLGPVGELLGVGLLDLGPLVHAVHEVIAEPVSVVDPLHRALVVPHLGWARGQAAVGAVNILPASAPAALGWLHQAIWGCRDGSFGLGLLKPNSLQLLCHSGRAKIETFGRASSDTEAPQQGWSQAEKGGQPPGQGCPGVQ